MKNTHTRSNEGGAILLLPGEPMAHSATCIFIHGLGDSGEGVAPICEIWARVLPHVKFVLPTAPMNPVTKNGYRMCTSWYDILNTPLEQRHLDPAAGLDESLATVEALVRAEEAAGITRGRIVVGGFSQGGAISIWAGLGNKSDEAFAGVLCLSGSLINDPDTAPFRPTAAGLRTPLMQHHGIDDPVIIIEQARRTRRRLEGANVEVEYQEHHGLEHSVNQAVLTDAARWLALRLPPPPPPRPAGPTAVGRGGLTMLKWTSGR